MSTIDSIGPILLDGRSFLAERQYPEIHQFKVEVFPNVGQHGGRPHCKVTTDKGAVTVDLDTAQIIAGDAGHWNRTVERTAAAPTEGLLALWDEMRPDDQRLPVRWQFR